MQTGFALGGLVQFLIDANRGGLFLFAMFLGSIAGAYAAWYFGRSDRVKAGA